MSMWMAPPTITQEDPTPPLDDHSSRAGTPPYLHRFCVWHLARCSTSGRSNWLFEEWMYMSNRIFHKAVVAKGLLFFTLRIFSSLELCWIVQNDVLCSLQAIIHWAEFTEIPAVCQTQALLWTLKIRWWVKQRPWPQGAYILVKNRQETD